MAFFQGLARARLFTPRHSTFLQRVLPVHPPRRPLTVLVKIPLPASWIIARPTWESHRFRMSRMRVLHSSSAIHTAEAAMSTTTLGHLLTSSQRHYARRYTAAEQGLHHAALRHFADALLHRFAQEKLARLANHHPDLSQVRFDTDSAPFIDGCHDAARGQRSPT